MTIAVSTIACGNGSAMSSAPDWSSDDRRVPDGPADDQEQQVDAVADQQHTDQHSGQGALQQQVDPAR